VSEVKAEELYLFTAAFPFGSHEAFLETEIRYLARRFRRVVVIPWGGQGAHRPLPARVELMSGLAETNRHRRRAIVVLQAMRETAFWQELILRPSSAVQPRALHRAIGYIAAARRTRIWVEAQMKVGALSVTRGIFYAYWTTSSAAALAHLRRVHPEMTAVSRAHGIDLYSERHVPAYLPLHRSTIRGLSRVYTVSDHGRRYLERQYPECGDRTRTARLGVDGPRPAAGPSSDGVLRIISCSNLYPVKRVSLLVKGLAAAAEQEPSLRVEWTHFGEGYEHTKVERTAAEHLPANVQWQLMGQVPNHRVLEWYSERPVDAFVNVSESEGVPVSVMEALSFGVPVVATAVGGTPEIVPPEAGALLDRDVKPDEIAAALLRCRPGSAAAERARTASAGAFHRCSARTNYEQFIDLLLEEARRSDRRSL